MGKINWGRVFLGGLLAGLVLLVLGTVNWFLFFRSELLSALEALGRPLQPTPGLIATWIALTFVIGIVTLWLYAAIRPRYGPGPKTAGVAAFVVWLILVLADVWWFSLGVVSPGPFLAAIVVFLATFIVAAVVGAWPYKE